MNMEVFFMSSTIQVRVDDDLKIKSDNLFKELGTDTTTAIRMFLTQAVANNGFPFEIKKVAANPYIAISEKEVLDRLAKSRDKVVVTNDAKENMQEYIEYILYEKKNQQTAGSLLDDFEYTKDILAEVAESLKLCDNEKLRSLGYRRISFKFHRYFMLYRVEDTTVYIDGIFHELQDFENKIN